MKKIILALSLIFVSIHCSAQTFAGGSLHSLAICSDRTVMSWGYNNYGQLGNGSTANSNIPVSVDTLTNMISVAGGYEHSLALKTDGTVWAWGWNGVSQCANAGGNFPRMIDSLTGIIAIAAGTWNSMALKNDGTVWTWGNNLYGQLGNGNNNSSSTPVQVNSLSGVVAIAECSFHSCMALKNDSTVWTWGRSDEGQLGNGNNLNSNVPVQVSSLTGVVAIAAGGYHCLALKSDGTVWTWGSGGYGELGNGFNNNSNVPVPVSSLSGVIAIGTGGYEHSIALKNDGTVWCWGRNNHGQVGDGTTSNSFVPLQVNNLNGIIAVAAGDDHSLALKNDGTLHAWGFNMFGGLGNGNNNDSYIPVVVNGLCYPLSIHGNETKDQGIISVFPNPSNGNFIVSVKNEKRTNEMKVFDLVGKEIGNWKLNQGGNEIDLSNLENGIYFVRVNEKTKKVIVEK